MSNAMNADIHLFLIQPINKKYNEMIVYANNEKEARAAAAVANDSDKTAASSDAAPGEIYLDRGMSICIEVTQDVIEIENNSGSIQVTYNEVIYDLNPNVAHKVISKNFF